MYCGCLDVTKTLIFWKMKCPELWKDNVTVVMLSINYCYPCLSILHRGLLIVHTSQESSNPINPIGRVSNLRKRSATKKNLH